MANVDDPHGFNQIGHIFGTAPEVEVMGKVVGYGTAIFIGDAVHQVADGSIEAAGTNFTPGTTAVSGVSATYGAASTATDHHVYRDPFTLFEAQDNDDTDGFTAAERGLNVNLEANAGNATTRRSGHELDESTVAVTGTLDLHLRRLYNNPVNAYGEFGRWEVAFNAHRAFSASAGI